MSNLSRFLKTNKIVKENVFYPVTKSLVDEKGQPMKWEFKAITTAQDEIIRDDCTSDVQVTGKPGMFRPKLDTKKYMAKMVCACCVDPCLDNAELQDSYGAKKAEDLLRAMVDNPGEYQDLLLFVQKNNGFDVTMDEKVEEAKN